MIDGGRRWGVGWWRIGGSIQPKRREGGNKARVEKKIEIERNRER